MANGKNATLTRVPLGSGILYFSLPLIFSNLLQVLFNMSDVAVVGQFAGAQALGAVGSTSILSTLYIGFLMGIGGGVNVLTARYLGAGDDGEVRKTVRTGFWLCLGFGVGIFLVGFLLARPILALLGTKDELIDGAVLYLKIYMAGMPAMALYNFGNGVCSAAGDTRRPLIFLSVAGVCNVALNLFFVIALDMSVAGVAIASVISQYLSAALIVGYLCRTDKVIGLSLRDLRPDRRRMGEIAALGVPAGVQNAVFQFANLFVQAGLNTFDTVTVEGTLASMNADSFVYPVMDAFYLACTSFISQNYGAGEKERARRAFRLCLCYSFFVGTAIGLSFALFGRQFLSVFTSDAAVVEAGQLRLRVMAFSYGISAFMDCTTSASRGLGKTVVPTAFVILGSCVFRVVWIYTVFAYFGTVTSLYLLYACSWILTAVCELAYYRRIKKRLLD